MSEERLESSFEKLLAQAEEMPEVKEYLASVSVFIGDIVLARRLQLKLTQEELAKLAGTTQRQISLIETAKGNVGQTIIDNVFKALNVKDVSISFHNEEAASAVAL
ncbi:helix-turn-helix domain-containing protein [Cohnella cellulosilytica]|uniref:Helix-turn-helix domain-containing protein n=1 Tax=Cohnella cellulosilytica TaxID=986710 RepID=A0ABW2FI11_9BACL